MIQKNQKIKADFNKLKFEMRPLKGSLNLGGLIKNNPPFVGPQKSGRTNPLYQRVHQTKNLN